MGHLRHRPPRPTKVPKPKSTHQGQAGIPAKVPRILPGEEGHYEDHCGAERRKVSCCGNGVASDLHVDEEGNYADGKF